MPVYQFGVDLGKTVAETQQSNGNRETVLGFLSEREEDFNSHGRELHDTARKYVVAVNGGAIAVVFALAGALAKRPIEMIHFLPPAGFFVVGLILTGTALLLNADRLLKAGRLAGRLRQNVADHVAVPEDAMRSYEHEIGQIRGWPFKAIRALTGVAFLCFIAGVAVGFLWTLPSLSGAIQPLR